ncbi:protease inhibitor I42 family protein [Paraburkholderia atlantica]|uniref:Inhibitor of cysteine peptidase n=1 Tax=Paraburkholderia atlantica TaxID=2654982 RepID=A0A7W8V3E2_PARAM|nr:protease inhibitor I42 family protein [Paraburkholderia atlantica]MBB5421629.1 inhibitor of cysteine peptidase [Paraburkholderia atlantica]MBB5429750.1 inhibitor of cysteine peptidase [Paraburkholderia atlantica]
MGLVLLACTPIEGAKALRHNDSRTITEADNGTTVELGAGETFVLYLSENATTGYRWAIDGLDTGLVELQESDYIGGSEAVGSGGKAHWTFHVMAPGTTYLKLKLWRPGRATAPF